MGNLNLRAAVPQDADLIVTYVRELAEIERLTQECVANAEDFRRFLFEEPRALALLVVWFGVLAGFALYFYNFSTFLGRPGLYLEDLFVRPAFRRNGIARAIFQALARKAVAEGCGRFEWSVLDWNENAIRFYRGLGAEAMDGWTTQRLTGDALRRLSEQT